MQKAWENKPLISSQELQVLKKCKFGGGVSGDGFGKGWGDALIHDAFEKDIRII